MGQDFYKQSILPYAGIILKICKAWTNSPEECEDWVQEVCLQIWRSRDSFDGKAKWSTWIYRLTLNVCMTNRRNIKKDQDKLNRLPEATNTETNDGLINLEIEALYAAIRQLGEIDRAVILLYLEEKSYKEIADITGTNANNIGVRITRIKEKLATLLDSKEKHVRQKGKA